METAKLLDTADGQHVVLPASLHLSGNKVFVKKVGNALVLLNKDNSWQTLFDSLDLFTEDFMKDREQPPIETRETLFE